MELNRCPGTLKSGFTSYSPLCIKKVFNGKKVSHILKYDTPKLSEEDNQRFIENRKRLSISGVQEKLSLILDKNKLRLTNEGEQGNYILKPIPRDLKFVDQVPANEHLTMQIAHQIYGIETAQNALIFFKSGEPAYLTKRFDIKPDGLKWGKEDFASLAQRTKDSHGNGYKYENFSYEEIADLIRLYVGAYAVEIEKYYKLVLFNYLFSNGDAHLKNFSLLETRSGDYILSPAYDLLDTRIHVADTSFALKNGLFKDGSVRIPKQKDFLAFGDKLGLKVKRRDKLFALFLKHSDAVHNMIKRSFLHDKAKKAFEIHYNTKLNLLTKK